MIYFSLLFVVILIVNIYVFNLCWFQIILPSKSWYHSIVTLIQTFTMVIARILFGCVSMICRDQVLEVKFFYICICLSKYCFYVCYLYVYMYMHMYMCVCVYIYVCICIYILYIYVYVHLFMHVCICVYLCVCLYVFVCVYI